MLKTKIRKSSLENKSFSKNTPQALSCRYVPLCESTVINFLDIDLFYRDCETQHINLTIHFIHPNIKQITQHLRMKIQTILCTNYNIIHYYIYAAKCIWFSIILNSSGGCGILPVSSLDHTGISFNEISKAPVDTNCPSNALQRKNIIIHE